MLAFIFIFALTGSVALGHSVDDGDENKPVCLKYDYEDKLLEKMMAIERKMERIQEKVKEKKDNDMISIVTDLSKRIEHMENSIIQFQRDVNQKLSEFDDKIKEEIAKLTALTDKSSSPIIAFDVRLSCTRKFVGKAVFDTVITNHGDGYDKSTGVFTAPHTGLYFFSAHVCSQGNRFVYYSISKEGTPLTKSTQYHGSGVNSCSSASTVVMVHKAEQVWVHVGTAVLHTNTYRQNTFIGFLASK